MYSRAIQKPTTPATKVKNRPKPVENQSASGKKNENQHWPVQSWFKPSNRLILYILYIYKTTTFHLSRFRPNVYKPTPSPPLPLLLPPKSFSFSEYLSSLTKSHAAPTPSTTLLLHNVTDRKPNNRSKSRQHRGYRFAPP